MAMWHGPGGVMACDAVRDELVAASVCVDQRDTDDIKKQTTQSGKLV